MMNKYLEFVTVSLFHFFNCTNEFGHLKKKKDSYNVPLQKRILNLITWPQLFKSKRTSKPGRFFFLTILE